MPRTYPAWVKGQQFQIIYTLKNRCQVEGINHER